MNEYVQAERLSRRPAWHAQRRAEEARVSQVGGEQTLLCYFSVLNTLNSAGFMDRDSLWFLPGEIGEYFFYSFFASSCCRAASTSRTTAYKILMRTRLELMSRWMQETPSSSIHYSFMDRARIGLMVTSKYDLSFFISHSLHTISIR